METKQQILALGVAYYPDYLDEHQRARLPDGKTARLAVKERIALDLDRMASGGLTLIRIGEFSWGHVEPAPGVFRPERFLWTLDAAKTRGLRVIFCTPTATPPKWLVDRSPEILPRTRDGRIIPFGGRRHYDPLSPVFRAESRRIARAYAEAFGAHPAVVGWQTDNELGNHTSSRTFTAAARAAFQAWLARRYEGDIARLNQDWFTSFWSMQFASFDQIELPQTTWTAPNPHCELAFRRFMSEAYRDLQDEQIAEIKPRSPGRFITHNITPMFFDLSLWQLTAALDVAGYDHYQCESQPNPVSSASQFNLMRSLKGGQKFMVLEQQPVQVNWQPVNARFALDWLFLWGAQAAALGAGAMLYFSWQRFAGGSEQYHDAVVPHDVRVPVSRQEKVIAAKHEFFAAVSAHFGLAELPLPDAQVLLINSQESLWAHEEPSQTRLWDGVKVLEDIQKPFLARGIGVDMAETVASAAARLSQYKTVILPSYAFELTPAEIAALTQHIARGGSVLSLPRTGYKEPTGRMSPTPLRLFNDGDFYFDEYGALLADERERVRIPGASAHLSGKLWAEKLVLVNDALWEPAAFFDGGLYDGSPAVIRTRAAAGQGHFVHLAFVPEIDELSAAYLIEMLGLTPTLTAPVDSGVQTYTFTAAKRRLLMAINFGNTPQTLTPSPVSLPQRGLLARLRPDLTLELAQDTAHDGAWTLAERAVGIWEI